MSNEGIELYFHTVNEDFQAAGFSGFGAEISVQRKAFCGTVIESRVCIRLWSCIPRCSAPVPRDATFETVLGISLSMGTKIYVGNLPWRATDAQLSELFGSHGEVTDARIVTDRETGRSRGFGFVTMASDDAAQAAIRALNGHSLEGRS
ncbi:MAG TPA: RNA-binding protein, partial [Burkholderiaceae bacterium]|nr:RNA-binding protein [Burkholderiaceae bacterium]